MSLRELRHHAGRFLFAGFSGTSIPVELRAIAREFDLGGVVLFARNVEEPEQVAELAFEASRLGHEAPAWVSIDQEGGRVARLKEPFTRWPPMATLGRADDATLAERFARALAAELRAVGVTMDFAPVLDVATNPKNPVIGDRALSEDAERVAALGRAIVRTLQSEGIAACGKHFPGHGDTSVDSHLDLPIVEHPPDRLRAVEFVPFRAAIDANVAAIMTGHLLVPALDEKLPGTLSPAIVKGLLREELGYDGLVLTDDLDMKGIANGWPAPIAVPAAVAAGCDGVLICGGDHTLQAQALEALIHAAEQDEIPFTRIEDAFRRQRVAKERFLAGGVRPPSPRQLRALLASAAHAVVAEEMARFA